MLVIKGVDDSPIDVKSYLIRTFQPVCTVMEVKISFQDAGFRDVSVVPTRSNDKDALYPRWWSLATSFIGTEEETQAALDEVVKTLGISPLKFEIGRGGVHYGKQVWRACWMDIPWEQLYTEDQVSEAIVHRLVEDGPTAALPPSQKAEVRILPANLKHHHDIMLISDRAPVYVGTIAPKHDRWRVIHTAKNVGREMRTKLDWCMPTKEECALRMIEVMRPFWKRIIARHAVQETEEEPVDPKAFLLSHPNLLKKQAKDLEEGDFILIEPSAVVHRIVRKEITPKGHVQLTTKPYPHGGFHWSWELSLKRNTFLADRWFVIQPPPVVESVADDITKEAAKAEKPASDEQAEAGNYKKGHVSVQGLAIAIENAKGSTRSGVNKAGKAWTVTMPAHYGYIKGTVGKDKDHLDVYIGENPGGLLAFVVNQNCPEGGFDEHKIMLGFNSKAEAIAAYDSAFSGCLGPKLRGSVVSTTVDKLKEWIASGEVKKPFESASVEEGIDPKDYLMGVPRQPQHWGDLKPGQVVRDDGGGSYCRISKPHPDAALVGYYGVNRKVYYDTFQSVYAHGKFSHHYSCPASDPLIEVEIVDELQGASDEQLWAQVAADMQVREAFEEEPMGFDEIKQYLMQTPPDGMTKTPFGLKTNGQEFQVGFAIHTSHEELIKDNAAEDGLVLDWDAVNAAIGQIERNAEAALRRAGVRATNQGHGGFDGNDLVGAAYVTVGVPGFEIVADYAAHEEPLSTSSGSIGNIPGMLETLYTGVPPEIARLIDVDISFFDLDSIKSEEDGHVEENVDDEGEAKDFLRRVHMPPGDIEVVGSCGTLVCDHATGYVKTLQDDGDDEDNYRDIERVNIDEFRQWQATNIPGQPMEAGHAIDIMFIGYWLKDGTYEPPLDDARAEYLQSRLSESHEEPFDAKAYMLAADEASPAFLELLPGSTESWNVYKKSDPRYDTTGHGSLAGTLFFDMQDDIPAHADPSWKEMNWITSPISPTRAQKAFKTKNEAIDYLLDGLK